MTSSNGNIFRVTGHLCGEITSPWSIPRTKASDAELWCFFDLRLNKRLSKQSRGWWFETPSRPLWHHYNERWLGFRIQATLQTKFTCKWWINCRSIFANRLEFPEMVLFKLSSLQWRHNGRDSVLNHQPHDCLLSRLFRRRTKEASKLRVTGLCAGNSSVPGEFPAQMASYAANVSIWWRHHAFEKLEQTGRHFAEDIFDMQSFERQFCILIKIAPMFFFRGSISQ